MINPPQSRHRRLLRTALAPAALHGDGLGPLLPMAGAQAQQRGAETVSHHMNDIAAATGSRSVLPSSGVRDPES